MHMMHDRMLTAVDVNLLVVLRALLRECHVTRAAAQVGLSQSATSHALSRLRELYGDELLVRQGRALVPTPRAKVLLPQIERGLNQLAATISGEPAWDPATARKEFTIGMVDYGQALLLGPLLKELQKQAPGVDLSVIVSRDLNELLEAGTIEAAVNLSGRTPPSIRTRKLFSESYLCMVRERHPQVGPKLTLSRYLALRHLVVAPSGAPGSVVDTILAQRGHERRVAVRVPNFLIAPLIVAGSDFINTGPERLARQMARRYPIRLLSPPSVLALPAFDMHLAWHARFDDDAAHGFLRSCITKVAAAL